VVHNISAVGFVVRHFVTIILDLNVKYVFLCTCALRANFGRFVTADYLKKIFIFFRLRLSLSIASEILKVQSQSQYRRAGVCLKFGVW
jgi:hypothetical protein